MSEHSVVAEWLKIAYDDYDTALFLFNNKNPKPLEIICYHCQQSVEKSIKAFLVANDVEFKRTHDIDLLCRQCAKVNKDFEPYIIPCGRLTVYAAETRYPLRIDVDDVHAEQALKQALEIYNFVSEILKLK